MYLSVGSFFTCDRTPGAALQGFRFNMAAAIIKTNFRARPLDKDKLLPIYRSDDHPEILLESAMVARTVPIMPTGMEKEEEEVCLGMYSSGVITVIGGDIFIF